MTDSETRAEFYGEIKSILSQAKTHGWTYNERAQALIALMTQFGYEKAPDAESNTEPVDWQWEVEVTYADIAAAVDNLKGSVVSEAQYWWSLLTKAVEDGKVKE